jgi:hypothetical protein
MRPKNKDANMSRRTTQNLSKWQKTLFGINQIKMLLAIKSLMGRTVEDVWRELRVRVFDFSRTWRIRFGRVCGKKA